MGCGSCGKQPEDRASVGRDQVARLMRAEQIAGVRRGKKVRTTRATAGADRHPDLVGRDFTD